MDKRSSTEHFVTAIGENWNQPVRCPKCGETANDDRKRRPSFTCADRRCTFRYGWRLWFGADLPDEQDATVLFAVPLDEHRQPLPELAVVWPAGVNKVHA